MRSGRLWCDAGESDMVRYTYDSTTGRRTEIEYPSGASVAFEYDALGRRETITHSDASDVDLLTISYTRDWTGRILTQQELRKDAGGSVTSNVTWTYAYDTLGRLKRAVKAESGEADAVYRYRYDDAGNRTEKLTPTGGKITYSYNALGQLTSDGTTDYEYDVYGNLVAERNATTEVLERRYEWDGENRLVAARIYDGAGELVKTAAYGYDDRGERVSRALTTEATGAEETVRYLVAQENPTGYSQVLAQTDRQGNAQAEYFWGDGHHPLAQAEGSAGAAAFFHGDHLGSTRLLTDGGGSAIAGGGWDYAPYGVPLSTGGPGSLTPYAFTGQWLDADTALQYHRARWLSCATANWLSVDPVFDFPGNFGSCYGYVGGNPLTCLDVNGAFTQSELVVTASVVSVLSCTAVGSWLEIHASDQMRETFGGNFHYKGLMIGLAIALLIPLLAYTPVTGASKWSYVAGGFLRGFITSVAVSRQPTWQRILCEGLLKGLFAGLAAWVAVGVSRGVTAALLLAVISTCAYIIVDCGIEGRDFSVWDMSEVFVTALIAHGIGEYMGDDQSASAGWAQLFTILFANYPTVRTSIEEIIDMAGGEVKEHYETIKDQIGRTQ